MNAKAEIRTATLDYRTLFIVYAPDGTGVSHTDHWRHAVQDAGMFDRDSAAGKAEWIKRADKGGRPRAAMPCTFYQWLAAQRRNIRREITRDLPGVYETATVEI